MTGRVTTYPVNVEFGDCDPAGIVFFPNFLRWIDSASRHYFVSCGVPSWTETEREQGIIGTPIVDVSARFLKPASYGDRLVIDTSIGEWRAKSFVMHHIVRRESDVLVEATEVRVFARRVEGDRYRIAAMPIPPFIRALCDAA
ncbi:MAG TPA: acyl-CoA thioesterase [Casimicrobiaceae bacterium]|nr:acyl-CoA thioesterase [Casimicrobiaceae bacterium]